MLESLHITNYALIDQLDVSFDRGLNIITGETGAGKSIIMGALSLLLGQRADTRVVRDSSKKSISEAHFTTDANNASLSKIFDDNSLDWEEGHIILRREIAPGGRSRAFVNDSPVSIQILEQIGKLLVDIHSQNSNQLLSREDYQLGIVDSMAGNDTLLSEYQQRFDALRKRVRELKAFKEKINRHKANEAYIKTQLEELRRVQPIPEDDGLEDRRDLLTNLSDIKRHFANALEALNAGDGNIVAKLSIVADEVTKLPESLIPKELDINNRLDNLIAEVCDISETLAGEDEKLIASPSEIEALDERITIIESLKRRFGVADIDALIAKQHELEKTVETIDDSEEILRELELKAKHAYTAAKDIARDLTAKRREAGERFAGMIEETARPLGMSNLNVSVNINEVDLSKTGKDSIEILASFNKNQQLTKIGGAASGGEISRLMLCIKSILATRLEIPTIIFDEVDTGVSGDVATRMAHLMAQISKYIQVISITHLPQVAAFGDTHLKVYKEDDESSTNTRIKLLDKTQRIGEIALMLSGDPSNEAAKQTAVSLLNYRK